MLSSVESFFFFLMFECTIRPESMACNYGYQTEVEIERNGRREGESRGERDKKREKMYD